MQEAIENENNKLIPSRIIKNGLDKVLTVLGMCLTNAIFEDMWNAGIVFGRNTAYSIDEIHKYFEQTLGKLTADLLVKELREQLANL